ADVITGKVTDADGGAPLQGVKIAASDKTWTYSLEDGTYRLDTEATGVLPSGLPPSMSWTPGANRLTWDAAYGDVRLEVRDLRGNVVDRYFSQGAQRGGGYTLKP